MPRAYLIDMDGVLVTGGTPIPGAEEFIERLKASGNAYMVLTNNSRYTARDFHARFRNIGLDIPAGNIFTSAMATALFLAKQRPHGTAYAIGESGLTTALHDVGYVLTDTDPDYVVVGETNTYSFSGITQAIRMVDAGARFIITNPDVNGPGEGGKVPGTGAVSALITAATGVQPYSVGKPNPLMMRAALRQLGVHSENSTMVGDRMDTDMIAGLESGLDTILVLSGVTRTIEEVERFPYRPTQVLGSVAEIVPE